MIDAARIGFGEDEFWLSTPAYFSARQRAHMETFKDTWEQTRFVAYVMAKTVDSKNKIKRPSDLLPFEWDQNAGKKFKKMSKADLEALKKFDEEADIILAKTQPEVWAKIQQAREAEKLKANGS